MPQRKSRRRSTRMNSLRKRTMSDHRRSRNGQAKRRTRMSQKRRRSKRRSNATFLGGGVDKRGSIQKRRRSRLNHLNSFQKTMPFNIPLPQQRTHEKNISLGNFMNRWKRKLAREQVPIQSRPLQSQHVEMRNPSETQKEQDEDREDMPGSEMRDHGLYGKAVDSTHENTDMTADGIFNMLSGLNNKINDMQKQWDEALEKSLRDQKGGKNVGMGHRHTNAYLRQSHK